MKNAGSMYSAMPVVRWAPGNAQLKKPSKLGTPAQSELARWFFIAKVANNGSRALNAARNHLQRFAWICHTCQSIVPNAARE